MNKRMTDDELSNFETMLLEHPPTQHADAIARVFIELKAERDWVSFVRRYQPHVAKAADKALRAVGL